MSRREALRTPVSVRKAATPPVMDHSGGCDGTTCKRPLDTDTPDPGSVFYYLVTAKLNSTGEETLAGYRSDGTLRTVDTGSSCN